MRLLTTLRRHLKKSFSIVSKHQSKPLRSKNRLSALVNQTRFKMKEDDNANHITVKRSSRTEKPS